jgi:hypothetical protein
MSSFNSFKDEIVQYVTEQFTCDFPLHTRVYKPKGYPFEGTVISSFKTMSGEQRYVVEAALAPGLLHIFNGNQLRKFDG